jgi:death on curing protein
MENARGNVVYLSTSDIIHINCRVILEMGGFADAAGRVLNPGTLEYLAEAVHGELFGRELHPTLPEKAAVYAFYINRGHVFVDGNKRTAMICAFYFLKRNGCAIPAVQDSDIVDASIGIADRTWSFPDVVQWFSALLSGSTGL